VSAPGEQLELRGWVSSKVFHNSR